MVLLKKGLDISSDWREAASKTRERNPRNAIKPYHQDKKTD